ncbi:DUF3221 domain-containing protein [Bacillus sp. FJAT-42376]|uniref:DUF3221 domain-containing protein n=1 Tax=Bacillus sp. FJAT-42376 TaxID=2014076 RepID=UPI0013DE3906|nr:DUF3221 domain-containing protein [Bacillus sp. FJAT-42376]
MKWFSNFIVCVCIILLLSACSSSSSTFTGYISNTDKDQVEVIKDISYEEFEKLMEAKASNENVHHNYVYYLLTYNSNGLKKGQKVKVWLPSGGLKMPNPVKAKAEKIQVLK